MPYADPLVAKEKARERYRRQQEQVKAAAKATYHANRESIRARRAELSPRHKAKNAERERQRYAGWRAEAVAAYGGACACCGETEPRFLEIDHVRDNGAAHRRKIGSSSKALVAWLRKHGYPQEDFRLLCSNCNQGRKRNGGICPHVSARPSSRGA